MRRVHFVAVILAAAIALPMAASSCATSAAVDDAGGQAAATASRPKRPDADPAALCQIKAEIDDASSRLKLAEVRERLEREALIDRAARFGALLAISDDQERFKAFHDDAGKNPDSAVGPLGECFVYASWKMPDQATGRCQLADDRLMQGGQSAAIVDVARAELHRRRGQLDEAQALIDNALSVDNGCPAALIEGARVAQARGENDKALASWQRARSSWSKCYLCAVEAAKLTETISTREAAVPLWEAALALQPDAADALKRYGAALAGVDDKRALLAYQKAIAAGQNDVSTLMGAAQLAAAAGEADKALAFADQAVQVQPNDIDAWRLILALAQKKGDGPRAIKASLEILRLVEEDLPALVVLARDARAADKLVDAVLRYDAAGRAIAGGRTNPLATADVDAVVKEHKKLLTELKVADRPAKGSAASVIASVKNTVQALFVERLKRSKSKKLQGMIEVAVTVSAAGTVDEVEIVKDTLGDAAVTASVVANLRRAQISGGAKRYSFQMDFM